MDDLDTGGVEAVMHAREYALRKARGAVLVAVLAGPVAGALLGMLLYGLKGVETEAVAWAVFGLFAFTGLFQAIQQSLRLRGILRQLDELRRQVEREEATGSPEVPPQPVL